MTKQLQPCRHSEETTTVSLHYLRAQIIRDRLEGLAHVEALMRLRGLDPGAVHVPEKKVVRFRKGQMRIAVLEVLRERSGTTRQIADALGHRHSSVRQCLRTPKSRGAVRLDGRVWRLAP
jgi:hypothetical protein